MKNNRRGIWIAGMLLCLQFTARAQYVLREADAQYNLYNYSKAIDLYEQAYKKKVTMHAVERLAICYQMVGDYRQMESWYALASEMEGSKPEHTLNYAKALQGNAKYSEAKQQYQAYAKLNPKFSEKSLQTLILSCDSALAWMNHPVPLTLSNIRRLNTDHSDWGAVPYRGGVVFTSDRRFPQPNRNTPPKPFLKFDEEKKLPDPKHYGWTGNEYLRIYERKAGADSIRAFPIKTANYYHIAGASFTGDEQQLYFSLTRIPEELKKVKGQPYTVNPEIFSSTLLTDGSWSEPQPFRYNKISEWSVGDPFISKDGHTLYFIANMPGGKGGTDLYVCTKNADGSWGDAVNLKDLNTEGNERSPFVAANGDLYFSSDGLIGMGGLDIYHAKKTATGFSVPRNMGYPFNSSRDDFAFYLLDEKNGYLSSNRGEGLGNDDIYYFSPVLEPRFKLQGIVYNKKTQIPVDEAIVTLSKPGIAAMKVETDPTGSFRFELDKASDYSVSAEKTQFRMDVAIVTTNGLNGNTILHQDLFMEPIVLEEAIRIDNIYYDFDSWNIRPDAALELDKLVRILKENETLWIELGSHTDSRGDAAYNLHLSQKRADAAVAYLISRGIARNRITAKGYGITKLISDDHQLNRRTEFKIVKK